MKKHYSLVDLDCANCAAKMETAIEKIAGVQAVRINFLTQRLTVEADEQKFEQIMDEIVKICRKIQPDCTICR